MRRQLANLFLFKYEKLYADDCGNVVLKKRRKYPKIIYRKQK